MGGAKWSAILLSRIVGAFWDTCSLYVAIVHLVVLFVHVCSIYLMYRWVKEDEVQPLFHTSADGSPVFAKNERTPPPFTYSR